MQSMAAEAPATSAAVLPPAVVSGIAEPAQAAAVALPEHRPLATAPVPAEAAHAANGVLWGRSPIAADGVPVEPRVAQSVLNTSGSIGESVQARARFDSVLWECCIIKTKDGDLIQKLHD